MSDERSSTIRKELNTKHASDLETEDEFVIVAAVEGEAAEVYNLSDAEKDF